MNKTININLDGRVFQIEEEAYDKLHAYLETIKKRLGKSEEAQEILNDIESRIAELFLFKSPEGNINQTLVEEIIETIGEPSEIVDEEDAEEDTTSSSQSDSTFTPPHYGRKALFRDKENAVFGGVCSGLGAYFDVDPVVFRILAVVTTLLSIGAVPVIYIVLWIAMPEAKTLEQRMRMRGGLTFKEFGDNIKNEYEAMSGKFKTFTNSPNYRNMQSRMNKTGDVMTNGLNNVAVVLGTILGIAIVLFSIISIMTIVGVLVLKDAMPGLADSVGNFYITNFPNYFLSSFDQTLFSISVGLLVGIPLLVILYLGLKMTFRFKTNGKVIGMSALGLWLAGIILLFFTSIKVVKGFEDTGSTTETIELKESQSETIYLEVRDDNRNNGYKDYLFEIKNLELYRQDGNLLVEGSPKITISKGDDFKVSITKKARGANEHEAEFNAQSTSYYWAQNDSILYLDKIFTLNEEALVRRQNVYVDIQIPYNKEVQVSPYLDRLIENY